MSLKYADEYARKFTFAENAVKVIESGNRVIYAFGICSINELDRALAMRRDELHDVKIICNDISCGYYAMDADFTRRHFIFHEGIYSGGRDNAFCEGGSKKEVRRKAKSSPNRDILPGHVFMASVSPMDKNGYFWFGSKAPEQQMFKEYYEKAEYVILEINERILEGIEAGQECIHISQANMIVGSNNEELLYTYRNAGKYYLYNHKTAAIGN